MHFIPTAPPVLEFDNKFRDLITLHAGSNLKIPVKVKGIPTPRITWAKEDQPMRSAGKVTIDTQDTGTSLTIKKVSKEEDGLYTLTAENEAGEDKAKFDVEVIGEFIIVFCFIITLKCSFLLLLFYDSVLIVFFE